MLVVVGNQKSGNASLQALLAASGDAIEATQADVAARDAATQPDLAARDVVEEIDGRASAFAGEAYRVTARRQGTSPREARLQ